MVKTLVLSITALLIATGCVGIQSRFHRVQSGDTWTGIASQYGVTAAELQRSNDAASTPLKGQKVYVPHESKAEWNGPELTRTISQADATALEDISPEKTTKERKPNGGGPDANVDYRSPLVRYVWPVSGRVSSKFGRRKGTFHEGIDIVAPQGMNVRASRSGHVIYSSNQISGYGNLVIIRHSDGFSTVYAHLSKRLSQRGHFVAKGTIIGKVGMTGRATSPHLHFELRKGQIPINPLQFLQGSLYARASR